LVLLALGLGWSFVTGGLAYAGAAGALWAALLVSVVLHELGHSMAARHYGIETAHITLYPFGGVAALERGPKTAREELIIALAGPAVNFALAAGAGLALAGTGLGAFAAFGLLNLVMGLFNLLPAFPMDGGRVFRAILVPFVGFYPASRLAIGLGRCFSLAFLGAGLWWTRVDLLLTGAFLWYALGVERERLVAGVWAENAGSPPPWVGASGSRSR
jgi:Zn-dependent protease